MPTGEERLVLLVRGDLFRRYPNTEVYALRAQPSGKRTLGDARMITSSTASCCPTLLLRLPVHARECGRCVMRPIASVDQGWFFVLQEQPAEPRFGLDVAAHSAARSPSGTSYPGAILRRRPMIWGSYATSISTRSSPTRGRSPTPGACLARGHRPRPRRLASADLASITLQRPCASRSTRPTCCRGRASRGRP